MAKKYSKNLQRVQDMLDGNRTGKIVVGQYDPAEKERKVGDKWTDSDDVQWEQMNGYRSKVSRLGTHHSWNQKCSDCDKLVLKKLDKNTYYRMGRCYHCQIDFEAMLKSKTIGHRGNKWQFWVKLQQLQRWETIDNEVEHLVRENSEVKWNDKKFLNALANNNIEMSIKKNLQ